MKVIVCGAGQVGFGIARQLAEEKNAVTVIDQSPELIQRVVDTLDAQAILGHGSHPDAGAARVRFDVKDTGPGLTDDEIKNIFRQQILMVDIQTLA